jgi:tetratricopeptide (TPR) repeat protein
MEGINVPVTPEDSFDPEGPLDQHYQVLQELGDCYAALCEYQRARECYNEAASLAPDKPGPYIGLGVIGMQTGRAEEAERAFRIAREIQPACAEAYAGLAMIHQHRREHPAAFEAYLKCLELDTDNLVALLGLFQTSCQMGTFSKIIHYLEVYLDRHPGDTSVLFCLATLYAREGRLARAREILLDVLALEPDKIEAAELLEEVRGSLAEGHAGVGQSGLERLQGAANP